MSKKMHNATRDAIDFVTEQMRQRKSVSRDDLIHAAVVSGFKHKTATIFTAMDHLISNGEVVKTARGHYALPAPAIGRPIEEASAANAFIETNKLLTQLRIEIDAANRRLASIEARTASTHQMVSQMHQQAEAKAIAGIECEATGSDAIGGTD